MQELLKEFSQGIFFNLLDREQICLVEKAGAEVIRQMEIDFLNGESTQEKYQEYFRACNIPPPPDSDSGGGQYGNVGNIPPPGESNQAGQGSTMIH